MPKLDVPARSNAINRHDDLKQASLTRDDVAKRLGVSVSTVRRFKPSDVEQLATTLAANQNTLRNAQKGAVRGNAGVYLQ